MLFVQMLNALDDILYKLVSWILFYPLTLWKMITRPLKTMLYVKAQFELDADDQYLSTVSPPIMLILTELISQAVSLCVEGADPILSNRRGLANLINDNTTLFLVRLVIFAVCALALAAREVHAGGGTLDSRTLKMPFYVQCFALAPVALFLGFGTIAADYRYLPIKLTGLIMVLGTLIFYFTVEVRWFRVECGRSQRRAIMDATIGLIASFLILLAAALLIE